MYKVETHQIINQIMTLFYRLGWWHNGDKATIKETGIKLFYSIYMFLFPLSNAIGAITTENKDERIFLIETTLITVVTTVKLLVIIWKKEKILELFQRIGVYTIDDYEDLNFVNNQLKRFVKFVTIFLSVVSLIEFFSALILPLIGSEKKLFINIGFPLDYHNDKFAFWMAYLFILTVSTLSSASVLFTLITWYLMISCVLKYKVLGTQLKKVGVIRTVEGTVNRTITLEGKQNSFLPDLISKIASHQYIKKSTLEMESFISNVVFLQIATSAICISVSFYSVVFFRVGFLESAIYIGILLYNTFDIFVVMHLGNEINNSSDELSYCLFESNWICQHPSVKKRFIIFIELLQQPHVLVVGKLYPLTLDTFTRILNGAYGMFNILRKIK